MRGQQDVRGTTEEEHGLLRSAGSWLKVALALTLVSGVLFAAWSAANEAEGMREDLLTGSRYAEAGIGAPTLLMLNGSTADLDAPVYAALKSQLVQVQGIEPLCRFAYVMGRRDDGTIFFYADSEPPESEDYSPPGQVYHEATGTIERVFATGTAVTTGAETDQWGTWISALIPITDTTTGRVVGLFGMDVDVADWQQRMAIAAIPPLLVMFLVGALLVLFSNHSQSEARERRRIEESEAAVRRSETLYRAIFESTGSATFIIEEDMIISLANARMAELSGYSREEIEGRLPWTVFAYPEDLPRMSMYHHARRLTPGEAPGSYGFRFLRRDGDVRQVVAHVGLIPGTTKSIASLHDVSDRIRAEEALQRANRKLVHLSQLTKTELANRLFVLHGYLELTRAQFPPDAPAAEFFSHSLRTATEMSTVLTLARDYGDLGVRPPIWQNVQLTFLLGASHLPTDGVRVECETGGLEVFADPLLERAFQGIVHNSLVHGGHVTTVRLAALRDGPALRLQYEDDGGGIPRDQKETLFALDSPEGGRIREFVFVREILEITGIAIRETGEPGRGARFELSVPAGGWRDGTVSEGGP